MDLNTITDVLRPVSGEVLPPWIAGDAFLAGGTWLFSEPRPHLRRLVDLDALGWGGLHAGPDGLQIGATCRIASLAALDTPADWRAGPLLRQCCGALLGSFKIWNMATVGGNLCLGLPAGPMIAMTAALDGMCFVSGAGGERQVPALGFVTGPQQTVLHPGEVLRAIHLPAAALRRRSAFRQISLSPVGRSAALLIGTHDLASGTFALTVTAATRHPVRIDLAAAPQPGPLLDALEAAIPAPLYYDDVHGAPDWRRHMTRVFATEICAELVA